MELTYKDAAFMIMDEVTFRESRHIMDCPYCKKYATMLAKIYYKENVSGEQTNLFVKNPDDEDKGS